MRKQTPHDLANLIAPRAVTPDQGCFVVLFGTAILLISVTFWFVVYLKNAQEFQGEGTRQGPPAAQIEREREAARRGRLNR